MELSSPLQHLTFRTHFGASNLARRRYQKGFLFLRGKREKLWIGRWMEDDLLPDGSIHRRRKSEVLGSIKDFPTKRLAQRELDHRLSVVNSPTYQARPTALFCDFAEPWKVSVLPNHRPSTQASENPTSRPGPQRWVRLP